MVIPHEPGVDEVVPGAPFFPSHKQITILSLSPQASQVVADGLLQDPSCLSRALLSGSRHHGLADQHHKLGPFELFGNRRAQGKMPPLDSGYVSGNTDPA